MSGHLARVLPPVKDDSAAAADDDSLLAFEAEGADPVARPAPHEGAHSVTRAAPHEGAPARRYPVLVPVSVMCVLALAALAIAYVYQISDRAPAAVPAAAPLVARENVTLTSEPPGATVVVGGVTRGVTPLKLELSPGQHQAEIALGTTSKTFALAVEPGTLMAQHVEFAAAAVADTGRLEVTSDPPGARVSVDGTPRGTTPLTLPEVAAGEHRITISVDQTTVQRLVTVSAGATASVTVALTAAGAAGGWAQIESPIELQVYESGQLIGSTSAARLMLPAGRRELEVANDELEFREPIVVNIQPGRTTTVPVEIPNGSLSVSALPWAEVLIDSRPAGTTPLGNVSVPIGTHEIIWRHPQHGERTRTVTVPAETAVRVGVDFTR